MQIPDVTSPNILMMNNLPSSQQLPYMCPLDKNPEGHTQTPHF